MVSKRTIFFAGKTNYMSNRSDVTILSHPYHLGEMKTSTYLKSVRLIHNKLLCMLKNTRPPPRLPAPPAYCAISTDPILTFGISSSTSTRSCAAAGRVIRPPRLPPGISDSTSTRRRTATGRVTRPPRLPPRISSSSRSRCSAARVRILRLPRPPRDEVPKERRNDWYFYVHDASHNTAQMAQEGGLGDKKGDEQELEPSGVSCVHLKAVHLKLHGR